MTEIFVVTTPEYEAREYHRTHARLYGGPHDGEFVKISPANPPLVILMYRVPSAADYPLQPWMEEFQYAAVAETTIYQKRIWRYGNDPATDEVRYYVRSE